MKGRWRVVVPGYGAYLASRIIWKMVHDDEPEVVDHGDGNSRNDRLTNLRAATASQNSHNVRTRSRTGYKGVTWNPLSGRFTARIFVDKRSIGLGSFDNPIEAHPAYAAAAERYYGAFARVK